MRVEPVAMGVESVRDFLEAVVIGLDLRMSR